jgi:hypothetical protein
MQWYYDGQIRRYVGQIVRLLSGFKYQGVDGKQFTVPVSYGDMTRQVANIIRDNSENKIPSAPRIAVYINDLQLDRTRLADSTHVSKVHVRERERLYDSGGVFTGYGPTQGNGYTVERLMPTPYKLTVKVDIWSTNTDQKLQILEQIMMLFNPSLELQTTDNYIDWTSISVLEISNIQFSGRTIPSGVDSEIDIATLTLETPIYISPPTKVKRLGVIQDIIMNIKDETLTFDVQEKVTISGFDIFVYADKNNLDKKYYIVELIDPKTTVQAFDKNVVDIWQKSGKELNWNLILDLYPGKFRAGSSQIFLVQPNGNQIVGTFSPIQSDERKLIVEFDQDTYNTNTVGNIDRIIDPETYNPLDENPGIGFKCLILNDITFENRFHDSNQDGFVPLYQDRRPDLPYYINPEDPASYPGVRELVNNRSYRIKTVGTTDFTKIGASENKVGVRFNSKNINHDSGAPDFKPLNPTGTGTVSVIGLPVDGTVAPGTAAWGSFSAGANDIIEWDGTTWNIIFDASEHDGSVEYTTNLRTGVQYKFEDGEWTRAFEGEYQNGSWRIIL